PYSEPTVGGWGGERRALRRAGRGRSAERAAVGNLALGDCENEGAVFAGEAGHENLRLEARHAFRAQAGRTHHLTPDELIRLVERGELCARLSDPEWSEVYPELVSRLAGFGKRFHSPDRPDTYSNTLEFAPGRNARGFSAHAGPSRLSAPFTRAASLSRRPPCAPRSPAVASPAHRCSRRATSRRLSSTPRPRAAGPGRRRTGIGDSAARS